MVGLAITLPFPKLSLRLSNMSTIQLFSLNTRAWLDCTKSLFKQQSEALSASTLSSPASPQAPMADSTRGKRVVRLATSADVL